MNISSRAEAPGFKTSEFWITAAFVGAGVAQEFVANGEGNMPVIATIVGVLYGASRMILKLKNSEALARAQAMEATIEALISPEDRANAGGFLGTILRKRAEKKTKRQTVSPGTTPAIDGEEPSAWARPVKRDPFEWTFPADKPLPEPRNRPFLVALIVGHNAKSQGAVAGGELEGLSEYRLNTAVADHLVSTSDDKISFVKFQRGAHFPGYSQEIDDAYGAAAAINPDLIVELHFNSGGGDYTFQLVPEGNEIAAAVGNVFSTVFSRGIEGVKFNGVKPVGPDENGGRGINSVSIPAILTEPFFGDNENHARSVANIRVDGYAGLYREACLLAAKALTE